MKTASGIIVGIKVVLMVVTSTTVSRAQVSVLGNSGAAGNYVGWDNTNAFPLQIRHNASQPISFFTSNSEQMRLDATGNLGIGITTPAYHLDILSPAVGGAGELQFRARSADDPAAWMSILNASAATAGISIPALHGEQSAAGTGPAFTTIGNIAPGQDLATNPAAINRFFASAGWIPNANGVQRTNVIQNRRIFDWMNGPDRLMTMLANGNLGLALNTPGNRLEINSDFYGTGGNPLLVPVTFATPNGNAPVPGGAAPTGFSGLRFSDLTSASIPQLNPGSGALSVDGNGDIILVPGGQGIGAGYCPTPTALSADAAINLNTFDYYFQAALPTEQVSIGLPCNASPISKLNVVDGQYPSISVYNLPTTARLDMAVATGAGFYSNIATANDAVIRADGKMTQDLILTTRNFNDGAIRFGTGNFADERQRMIVTNHDYLGYVGVGDNFSVPASRVHLHEEYAATATFAQLTNLATGILANDGLRIGVNENSDGVVYNQEHAHLLFSTGHAAPTAAGVTDERVRITHIKAPTDLPGGGIGVHNPAGLNPDLTRVSISHDPNNPVTRPLTLLHLGYNTGDPFVNDGWRKWMDVGMFESQETDHLFLGFKREEYDRYDAVLNWGDNTDSHGGPDNLRFIFTAPSGSGASLPPSNGGDGLEGMRMTPAIAFDPQNAHMFTGIGGDPNANLYYGSGVNPTNTLEVNSSLIRGVNDPAPFEPNGHTPAPGNLNAPTGLSGLRFTDLTAGSVPEANPRPNVLSVNGDGDVILVPDGGSGLPAVACPSANPAVDGLQTSMEVPLNNFNLIFSGTGANTDKVGIGNIINCNPAAKLEVENTTEATTGLFTNTQSATSYLHGIESQAINLANVDHRIIGVKGFARGVGNKGTYGVFGEAFDQPLVTANSGINVGVYGNGKNAIYTYGGQFLAETVYDPDPLGFRTAYGISATATTGDFIYGVEAIANPSAGLSNEAYGIYATAPLVGTTNAPPISYAGWFDGDVSGIGTLFATGPGPFIFSDENVKQNVAPVADAIELVRRLQPRTYDFNIAEYPYLNFRSGLQYGFISQEVDTVLPELVTDFRFPAERDSSGVIIRPEQNFKALNYTGLIPVAIQAIKEQQHQIDSLKQELRELQATIGQCCQADTGAQYRNGAPDTELMDRLDEFEQSLTACCLEHHGSSAAGQSGGSVTATAIEAVVKDMPVLSQNQPNPFNQESRIRFYLPKGSNEAAIKVFDQSGSIHRMFVLSGYGPGSVVIEANSLSPGSYQYSLVIDRTVVDTKSMLVTH